MFNFSDFTDYQKESESAVIVALSYDYNEHAMQQKKRDDDSRVEYHAPEQVLQAISYSETCERCGKAPEVLIYIWNGKRLCKSCMEEGQETWVLYTSGPNAINQSVSILPLEKAKQVSRIESLISGFLAIFDLERIEEEIIILDPKIPIKQARLLALQRPDKKQMPKSEGIMNRKQYLPNR